MNITLETNAFKNVLKTLKAVIPQHPTNPYLENLHFHLEDGLATITASDLENTMQIVTDYASDDQSEREFLIEFKMINTIVGTIKDRTFELEIDDELHGGVIKVKRGSFDFPIISSDMYITIDFAEFNKANTVKIPSDVFVSSLKKSQTFALNDPMYMQFTGANLKLENNVLSIYSTDRHRMYRKRIDVSEPTSESFNILLQRNAVALCQSFDKNGCLELKVTRNKVKITNGTTTFVFNQLDLKFPNCDAIIPVPSDYFITVDKQEFIDTLKQAQVCSKSVGEDAKFDVVKLSKKNGKVLITANNLATGRNADLEICPEFIKTNEMDDNYEMGLDGAITSESLSVLDTTDINVYFTIPQQPVVAFAVDAQGTIDESEVILVMPKLV